ncbi:MAG: hypothetical protein LH632_14595, partial [Rhodoferax sp.]|nr:hypothetical protein [Rhodoferax sp.]
MTDAVIAALPAMLRTHLEPQLPPWLEPRWFAIREEAVAAGPLANMRVPGPVTDVSHETTWQPRNKAECNRSRGYGGAAPSAHRRASQVDASNDKSSATT